MKIRAIRYLMILSLVFFEKCKSIEQELDGAYQEISNKEKSSVIGKDTLHTVALFKEGYWISVSFTENSITKCFGGTFTKRNEQYIQTVHFNSADTSTIGKEYIYEYHSGDKYLIANFAGNGINDKSEEKDAYEKISNFQPLKNASLEGAWLMKPGQTGYNTNNEEVIRIFAYPSFARVIYNKKNNLFVNIYGGSYQFDGKELTEKIEYSNYQIPAGSNMEWSVKKLDGNEIQIFDIDSFNDEEIFDRVSGK